MVVRMYNLQRKAKNGRADQKALMKLTWPTDNLLDALRVSKARYNAMVKLWRNSDGNIDPIEDMFHRR